MLKKKKKKKPRVSVSERSLITLSVSGICSPGPRVSDLLSANSVFLRPEMKSPFVWVTWVWCVLAPPPLLNELRAIPSGSHHLPLFSLSLALISTMCNESYLKPTKTSSTSLSQFQGELRGRYRQEEESLKRWGAWEGEGSSSPLSDPPLRLPRS